MAERVRKVSEARLADALRKSGGIMAEAARLIEQATGQPYTRQSVQARVKESPVLQEALEEGREMVLDLAETRLHELLREGDEKAVFFALKMRGKSRGYSERLEQTGADGAPLMTGGLSAVPPVEINIVPVKALLRKDGSVINPDEHPEEYAEALKQDFLKNGL